MEPDTAVINRTPSGTPPGILTHRLVIAAITHSAFFVLPAYMINVWSVTLVATVAMRAA